MELIRGFRIWSGARGCVVTIGTFDGIHLGHQALIRVLRDMRASSSAGGAADVRADAAGISGQGESAGAPDALAGAVEALRHYGVERFVCLRFDSSAADHDRRRIRGVLAEALGAATSSSGTISNSAAAWRATAHAAWSGPAAGLRCEVAPVGSTACASAAADSRGAGAGDLAQAARCSAGPIR